MTFKVIDKRTGKEPIFDFNHIFREKWFKTSGLIYCDIDGWYIGEDGTLVLADDCGRIAYPPADRFDVVFEDDRPKGKWIIRQDLQNKIQCSECGAFLGLNSEDIAEGWELPNYCSNCGSDMEKKNDKTL
jgi:hypothetical protein